MKPVVRQILIALPLAAAVGLAGLWFYKGQRRDRCEWVLLPFPEGRQQVAEGQVSVCIGNLTLRRQRCHFSAGQQLVKKLNGRRFRYSDMSWEDSMPRRITGIKYCRKEPARERGQKSGG